MSNSSFQERFEQAKEQLSADGQSLDLRSFEREVWAEISFRDERWMKRVWRIFSENFSSVSRPALAGSIVMAALLGVLLAVNQANAYGESRAQELEQRYVATIHSVLRSESGGDQPDNSL